MTEGREAKLKRRETKSWEQDAGQSPLVRAGTRWLSFARSLSRRRRAAAADPLAFVESLYGGRFKSVEGGALALEKIYRTNGGRLFVSETRVSVSLHPRFDMRFVNIEAGGADPQAFRETRTVFGHLLHTTQSGRERPRAERQGARADAAAPSLTVRAWNVSQTVAAAPSLAFGYVAVRGSRGHEPPRLEPTSPASRVVRLERVGGALSPSVEASRRTVPPSPAAIRQTSIDLRQDFTNAPRQEFVSLLLNTYLHAAAVSREVESRATTGVLLSARQGRATAQGAPERRFAQAPPAVVAPGPQPAQWAYAGPAPRQTPDGRSELRTESRTTETVRETRAARDKQAPLLHLLAPASLLTSLSYTAQTLPAAVGGASWLTAYVSSERAPLLSLQLIRPQAPHPAARGGSAVAHTTRPVNQSILLRPTGTRDVFSSTHTLVGRAASSVAAAAHAVKTTVFARRGFEAPARGGQEEAAQRRRGASSVAAQTQAPTHGLSVRSVEFVRHTSVAESMRAGQIHGASAQTTSGRAPDGIPTHSTLGAGSFLFAAGVARRVAEAAAARPLSPTVASARRLSPMAAAVRRLSPTAGAAPRWAPAAVSGRAAQKARAARPEGMALELIRHRREEVLQLPQPGYVFTQPPARAQLEERQVITKASREEIVEVVRREVRTLAASEPPAPKPSRADLAGLADEIYSTLARRLLVEKERLGRL